MFLGGEVYKFVEKYILKERITNNNWKLSIDGILYDRVINVSFNILAVGTKTAL